jgi:hypothetical protein
LDDVSPNLAKLEWHAVAGQRRRLCVHRKGATRALPPATSTSPPSWLPPASRCWSPGPWWVPYSQQMATALLASLPTLLVYLPLGRFFMLGLMAGALKG